MKAYRKPGRWGYRRRSPTPDIHVHVETLFINGVPPRDPAEAHRRRQIVAQYVGAPPPSNKIGDTLAMVPFLYQFRNKIRVTGDFNRHVIPLLESMPIEFDLEGTGETADFTIGFKACKALYRERSLHMGQLPFHQFDLPIPSLPIHLPLRASPCDFPSGIVLSPFSHSDHFGTKKIWPHERWVYVVQTLRRLGLADRAYVLGSHDSESTLPFVTAYAAAGIQPVFDRPLTEVLDLIRRATLVLNVDNGIGHLAHFGGVMRHVMVYPDCLPPLFAEAPMALHVRGPTTASISVDQVIEASREVLSSV